MTLNVSHEAAAAAAKRILGFFPDIPASDPKGFAAGLVQTLSNYPPAVVARAVDPATGIPAHVEFLNLARIKKLLDGWYDEHYELEAKRKQWATPRVEFKRDEPSEESKSRVLGWRKLSAQIDAGIGPSQAMDD